MSNCVSYIHDKLYVSNYLQSINTESLLTNNIKAILHVGVVPKPVHILNKYAEIGVAHKYIQILETPHTNLKKHFNTIVKYIELHVHQGHNILIHCRRGINRSPAIVAFYILYKIHKERKRRHQIDECVLEDIIDLIKVYRPCVSPNVNFLNQISQYEKKMVNSGIRS